MSTKRRKHVQRKATSSLKAPATPKFKNSPNSLVLAAIVLGALVVLTLSGYFLAKGGPSTGQAVFTQDAPSQAANSIWIGFESGTAAVGDLVAVPIKFNTQLTDAVTNAEFSVEYDHSRFSILPADTSRLPKAGAGFVWAGDEADVAASIDAGNEVLLGSLGGVAGQNTLATLYFRVIGSDLPDETDETSRFTVRFDFFGAVDDLQQYYDITLDDGFIAQPDNKYEIFSDILIVPMCDDADNDGWGKPGTDRRGCGGAPGGISADEDATRLPDAQFADCDDDNSAVHPKAVEVCNAIDDNCVNGIDEDLTFGPNANFQGVCAGFQVCEDGERKNSYEADNSPYTFTDPDGTVRTQTELYNPDEDVCDYYDNNCNGQINEDAPADCLAGGSPNIGLIASATPGNVFFEYDPAGTVGAGHLIPQVLDPNGFDLLLYRKVHAKYIDTGAECGHPDQSICSSALDDTWEASFCFDNVYYIRTADDADGTDYFRLSALDDFSIVTHEEVPTTC